MKLLPGFVACIVAVITLAGAPAAAQEDPAGDEGGGETATVKEKKVAYTFTYFVRTHGEKGPVKKPAKPAKPSKKDKGVAAGPQEPALRLAEERPAEQPNPAISLELKGGKLVATRANIMVNRTVDLGVTFDIFTNEVRLNEFVKATREGVGTEFDMIDVISTLGGLEPGEYSLVYFDVDGKEAFNGKFTVK